MKNPFRRLGEPNAAASTAGSIAGNSRGSGSACGGSSGSASGSACVDDSSSACDESGSSMSTTIYYFWRPLIKSVLPLLATEECIEQWAEFLRVRAYMFGALLYAVVYILLLEPLSVLLFESQPLRYKAQMYLYRPFEFLLASAFKDILVFESVDGELGANNLNSLKITTLAAAIANHQGFIDYLTMIMLLRKAGVEDSCFFFVFKHCVRLPSLRVLYNMWRRQSNWRVPNISLSSTFAPVVESPWLNDGGKCIVMFPEVMPWTATSMLADRQECSEQGCPKLHRLLYPRFNAFVQAISYLRDFPLGAIYDISIEYVDAENNKLGVPSIRQLLFSSQKWRVYICIKKYPISSLPVKEKHLIRWLENLWFRKDAGLAMRADEREVFKY